MVEEKNTVSTFAEEAASRSARPRLAALLVAHAPAQALRADRFALGEDYAIGRSAQATVCISDDRVSSWHARVGGVNHEYWIEDTGSRNGTYLNGRRIEGRATLQTGDVIRLGRVLLVFQNDAAQLLRHGPVTHHGMAGPFHTAAIIEQLEEAALSARHLLVTGPSGVGKELAASALSHILGPDRSALPMLSHNAARFASADEAATTLFGVAKGVFSGVAPRRGLIEEAADGVLFLDEAHNLPDRIQRGLLRVMEDGEVCRIGETSTRPARVRFILATNVPAPSYGLAHDLFARLRALRLPPLVERRADIPSIFRALLSGTLERRNIPPTPVLAELTVYHCEALCLNGFETDNIRGLLDLADRIATRIGRGHPADKAVPEIMEERLGTMAGAHNSIVPQAPQTALIEGPTSHYDTYRLVIEQLYRECRGNLSATERALASRGISSSRRWLRHYLRLWGVRG
ncbi:MAG: sigma 54-interacting transcriptional regulator [Myxococcota bacterium]|jgi:transcriptional regulator with AAA-type ATPase domain|nr:sigma 54-interacting transcriptional regulator [Myxococcota bacterium]